MPLFFRCVTPRGGSPQPAVLRVCVCGGGEPHLFVANCSLCPASPPPPLIPPYLQSILDFFEEHRRVVYIVSCAGYVVARAWVGVTNCV